MVPCVGSFFTPLKLVEAFKEYDEFFCSVAPALRAAQLCRDAACAQHCAGKPGHL